MYGRVYGIFTKDDTCIYVGQTVRGLKDRWREHRSRALKGDGNPVYRLIRELGSANLEIREIATAEGEGELHLLENATVAEYKTLGHPLTNEAMGGPGSFGYKYDMPGERKRDRGTMGIMPLEQRMKISATLKGIPKPEGFGEKISAANRGEKHPMAKLTREQAIEIIEKLKSGRTPRELSIEYGVNPTQIRRIKNGDRWKDLPR